MSWLDTYPDIRNQLACYLRMVGNLMELCKFQWAGAALIGLHITVPYMSMLLDHKVTTRQLLDILPQLYSDLTEYPLPLTQMDACAIPALQPYYLNPF